MSKPSIPKGTRDFLPTTMVKRNYIFSTIKKSFIKFGFLPIETPCMENTSTLMGKYGEEGDRLIFKILESGDFMSKLPESTTKRYFQFANEYDEFYKEYEQIKDESKRNTLLNDFATKSYTFITEYFEVMKNSHEISKHISEKALRYDLTVPFARFVVQHQNEIAFPFKRYQIQPVWRADRPQKGRYREFYQCDADVVGSDALIYEVELVQLFDEVLSNLGIKDFTIKINNRKILSGIAEITGMSDKIIDITVAIDKLDKIGAEGVIKELREKEIPDSAIDKIKPLFELKGNNSEIIEVMKKMLLNSEMGMKGIEELEYVFEKINLLGLENAILEFDVTLARGLNYYTGAIFEVKADNVSIGSICGGGRYDDLTGIFGLKGISGVGISFGADRIYDVMEELQLFPSFSSETTQLLLINFGEDENKSLQILNQFRKSNINTELYPTDAKLKKQMSYADAKNIPYVLFLGEKELKSGSFNLKNMASGEQTQMNINEIIEKLNP